MRFDPPLVPGSLVRRYKRFIADVRLADGTIVHAHTPNTGRMTGCSRPGSPAWLQPASRPGRKLPYTLEIVADGDVLVGVHTGRSNRLAEAALLDDLVPGLAGFRAVRREVRLGRSRIDLLLDGHVDGEQACFVEVKNVTYAEAGVALFPDAVTERGRKHLAELESHVARGGRAAMLFIVQRGDCDRFAPADAIDPTYGEALRRAAAAGVETTALAFRVTPEGIGPDRALPVDLEEP